MTALNLWMISFEYNVSMDRIELAKPIRRDLVTFVHFTNMLSIYSVTNTDLGTGGPSSEKNKAPALGSLHYFRWGRQQTDKYITYQVVIIPYLINKFTFTKLSAP